MKFQLLAFIERIEPQDLFSFRCYDDDSDRTEEAQASLLNEFRFKQINGGTRLTITESVFSALADGRQIEKMRSDITG